MRSATLPYPSQLMAVGAMGRLFLDRNGKILAGTVGIIGLMHLLGRISTNIGSTAGTLAVMMVTTFDLAGIVILSLIFILRQANAEAPQSMNGSIGNGSSYPVAMMTLPVADGLLISAQMFFTALSMGVVVLVTAGMGWLAFDKSGALITCQVGICLICFTLCLQAVCWSRIRGPLVKPFLCTVLMGFSLMGPSVTTILGHTFTQFVELYVGLTLASIPLAVIGFRTARHGYPPKIDIDVATKVGQRKEVPKLVPFKSKLQTLLWSDRRRHGQAAIWVTGFFCFSFSLITLLIHWNTLGTYGTPQDNIGDRAEWLIGLVIMSCFLLGSAPRRVDLFMPDRRINPFLATRPLSGTDVTRSLFVCSARTGLISWALLVLTLFAWCSLHAPSSPFGLRAGSLEFNFQSQQQILLTATAVAWLLVLIWNALTLLLTAEISGNGPIGMSFVATLAVIAVQASVQHNADPHSAIPYELFTVILWAAVGSKLILAGVAAANGITRGLFRGREVTLTFGVWLAVAVVMLAAKNACCPPMLFSSAQLTPGMILTIPLARLFVAPISLEWNRHQ